MSKRIVKQAKITDMFTKIPSSSLSRVKTNVFKNISNNAESEKYILKILNISLKKKASKILDLKPFSY